MARRRGGGIGLGPVFAVESVIGARRWQLYATRMAFVALLLTGLTILWLPLEGRDIGVGELGQVGRQFFRMLVGVQLAVICLAAPAATAGAICVDKARGTLLHVMATDLTDREVVLGKLGARLGPIVGLLLCGLPVLAIAGLLGGVEPSAALGAYLLTFGMAASCCALALFLSVWARKPHQALLATYAIEGLGLALYPIVAVTGEWFGVVDSLPMRLAGATNPIVLAVAPEEAEHLLARWTTPGSLLGDWLTFTLQVSVAAALLVAAAALMFLASRRLRPVVLSQAHRPAKREKPGLAAKVVRYLPGPPLDGNPVLWREWHRKRPSKWTGRFWTLYAILSTLASLWVLAGYYVFPAFFGSPIYGVPAEAAQVNAWNVTIGLLLLSVSAATALAEERDRGSLDVILATPLPTGAIVWGKWLGAFAMVPRLAILPAWVAGGLAMVSGSGIAFFLMVALVLAQAAAITSLGLLIATWVSRLGRAVAWSVTAYLGLAAGAIVVMVPLQIFWNAYGPGYGRSDWWDGVLLSSPYFGVAALTQQAGNLWQDPWYLSTPGGHMESLYAWSLFWVLAYSALAGLLALLARASFDRKLGRVPEAPRTPRPAPVLAAATAG
ncbi:MAG TPA: ABC transporter permease [Isosphaeraceae bacterium]|jgi:ABC-type transport system involved in multi-copper enzyme maturation permease subunit|nr:ABC transporter permease [Isosphaeraceae bacterium]